MRQKLGAPTIDPYLLTKHQRLQFAPEKRAAKMCWISHPPSSPVLKIWRRWFPQLWKLRATKLPSPVKTGGVVKANSNARVCWNVIRCCNALRSLRISQLWKVTSGQPLNFQHLNRNNSASDCSVSLKSGKEFDYVTVDQRWGSYSQRSVEMAYIGFFGENKHLKTSSDCQSTHLF